MNASSRTCLLPGLLDSLRSQPGIDAALTGYARIASIERSPGMVARART